MSGSDGWEAVIGVEVHVQLRTRTKMFCACPAAFGAAPNAQVCPVCLGLPGALPVPNREAVALAVRAALALGCRVHARSEFVRKNYFYPDLPKGYQITQFERPLATGGAVLLRREGEERTVRIRRLHLEEDAGKSLHDRVPGRTAVDLNRAGVPLVEIVTEPDLRAPEEARAYLVRLKQLLEHFAAVSDCNMEEGSLRVDANISVRPYGEAALGTKTEVKNLNSFRFVERALAHERARQAGELAAGRPVLPETRRFDPAGGETRPLRGKEEAMDYRYFPEPDMRPLELSPEVVARAREALGPPPPELERRFEAVHGLPADDAALMAATPQRAAYFERAVGEGGVELARTVANLLLGEVSAELNRRGAEGGEAALLAPERLRRVAELRLEGTLSSDTADRALRHLFAEEAAGSDPATVDALVRDRGLAQVGDPERIRAWVEEAVAAHPEEVARYTAGEEKLFGFFMGAAMRAAGGRADPARLRQRLRERLRRGRDG